MEQPPTRPETPGGDALTAAAARLERAVAALQAKLDAPPSGTAAASDALALQGELTAALAREQDLQTAAAAASQALGRAMAEVKRTLEAEDQASGQGTLDLMSGPGAIGADLALESAAKSPEDTGAGSGEADPDEEPAA